MMRTTLMMTLAASLLAMPATAVAGIGIPPVTVHLDLPDIDGGGATPLVAIGAQATTSCSATHANGEGTANGPASSASAGSGITPEVSNAHESDNGPLYAYAFDESTGGPGDSSASATASSGLGVLDTATSSCRYTHPDSDGADELVAFILGLVNGGSSSSASFSVGCLASTLAAADGAYDGTLQVTPAGDLLFVGTWTDASGSTLVALPAGSGLMFVPGMTGTAPDGLSDTGLGVRAVFTSDGGASCDAEL